MASRVATKLPQTAKTTKKHAKTDFLTVKFIEIMEKSFSIDIIAKDESDQFFKCGNIRVFVMPKIGDIIDTNGTKLFVFGRYFRALDIVIGERMAVIVDIVAYPKVIEKFPEI